MAGGIAERVRSLIADAVAKQNVELWDVRFVKEGAAHYLRIYIDSERGINIDDCTNVSHVVDPILDEADPIDMAYYLEVCSPGLERELTRPEHFEKMLGREVTLRLYRAQDGVKEYRGTLQRYENGCVCLTANGAERTFDKKDISSVHLVD